MAALAAPSPFVGTYQGKDCTITIRQAEARDFSGEIVALGKSMRFSARDDNGSLVGNLNVDGDALPFKMTLKGSVLTVAMEGEEQTLIKQQQGASSPSAAAAPELVNKPKPTAPGQPVDPAQVLRVNDVVVDDAALRKFEQEHHLKIPRGDFWYDKVSGGWGITGGPTLGFTAPGMNLGGPLKAGASRGNTGVFINNRELPLQDVIGLRQLGVPVQQGRWWVDSRGGFGVEGNPIQLGNIFQFSQSKGGAYQRATAGGYIGGDGQTSYFFDPKSGSSVMVGN